jgi:vacuolar-type H+-ATPase subunit H
MPNLLFQFISITADLVIFIFIGFYLWKIRNEEGDLKKKETKADVSYHQIVDDALGKERKIMEDAVSEADKIIVDAEYIKKSSKEIVDQALQQMVAHIQKESIETAGKFMNSYSESLKELATTSLVDFQNVAKGLEGDLQRQIKEFRETLLPDLKKELDDYKQVRLKQSDEIINHVIQKAAQEIMNKSISLEDHQKILADALERAKTEGVFD